MQGCEGTAGRTDPRDELTDKLPLPGVVFVSHNDIQGGEKWGYLIRLGDFSTVMILYLHVQK